MTHELELSEAWSIRPDPTSVGLSEHFERESAGWTGSHTIMPARTWHHALGQAYRGVAWYSRRIPIPDEWRDAWRSGDRLWVRFESVATDTTIWVNDALVGRHTGDWLPFQFDITRASLGVGPALPDSIWLAARVDQLFAEPPAAGTLVQNGHITKGFHDVLSLAHGGIWGRAWLRRTGRRAIIPNGLGVIAAADSARVEVEFEPSAASATLGVEIFDANGAIVGRAETIVGPAAESANVEIPVPGAARWSPDAPTLYTARARIIDASGSEDSAQTRFGFREIGAGGQDGRRIVLNGVPLLFRGVLHWGHEPALGEPAPPPEQVRAEFARLREMGFNGVCLCMWYPPAWYHDIADETGMLLWQQHPLWKSSMAPAHMGEYRRLFEGFFRRDRNHPSVVIVSATCEHEAFDPGLRAWWFERARDRLGPRLLQSNTAFLDWTDPSTTDLHDEHVYESSGRWASYLGELEARLASMQPKPFVMGETVIGTSWIDVGEARRSIAAAPPMSPIEERPVGEPRESPWWSPRGIDECAAFEEKLAARYGPVVLERFRACAQRQSLATRKFQSELFRMNPSRAGWVMNQIRDVATARLGFMDEAGRWRFEPAQTRPWLSDAALLLETPNHRRVFSGGRDVPLALRVSNFSNRIIRGPLTLTIGDGADTEVLDAGSIECEPGDSRALAMVWRPMKPRRPKRRPAIGNGQGVEPNEWEIELVPEPAVLPPEAAIADEEPLASLETAPDFEERRYSSGWGLEAAAWRTVYPAPRELLPRAPVFSGAGSSTARVVVARRLTLGLVEFMKAGGRVLLLASRGAGGVGSRFVTLWGQCPLVIEEGPLEPGDAAWIENSIHHDLTRRHPRAIPVEDLRVADALDPLIRLVFTHDRGVPKVMDLLSMTRVGAGLLMLSAIDHTEDAGRHLLDRCIAFLALDDATARAEIDPQLVRPWCV